MNFILQAGQPYVQPPAYTHLKRARSRDGDGFNFNPALAPPLPPITNIDTLLQVFTHPSIRRQPSPMAMETDDYADNERLAFLGKLTLEAAVIRSLFNHRPMLKAYQMTVGLIRKCTDLMLLTTVL
jgi:dsRNA-specific ribonuclease